MVSTGMEAGAGVTGVHRAGAGENEAWDRSGIEEGQLEEAEAVIRLFKDHAN
jgi:hypothetical protein